MTLHTLPGEQMPAVPDRHVACRVIGRGSLTTHLVALDENGSNGGRPTVCGLTRFDRYENGRPVPNTADLPGWGMGNSGITGPGVRQIKCGRCYELAEPNLARQHQAHLDANGPTVGDCWRTAIACLLEIPRDTVPHWMEIYKDQPESVQWWYDTVAFVEAVRPGWTLTLVRPPSWPIYSHPLTSHPHVLLTGQSPRGDWLHVVIADAITGDLVWDPHPAGGGVLTHTEAAVLTRLS